MKQFFKKKFKLNYLPNIRTQNCKELGYPVVFELLKKYNTTYNLYMTYNGIIKNIHTDHCKKPEYNRNGLSCLRYNKNFMNFDYWISRDGQHKLDSSCIEKSNDLPARNNRMNDNKLLLKHFISNNKIPDRLVEFWDDELYVSWKVNKYVKKIGTATNNKTQILSDFITGVYVQSYFSKKYIDKCLKTFQTDLNMYYTIDEFIISDIGIKSKQLVPNKEIGHIYNLNFSNYLK